VIVPSPCCGEGPVRTGGLPLVRGTPRNGDLLCVSCRWVTPRELRDLPSAPKEWCPTHGSRNVRSADADANAAHALEDRALEIR
jgi:hypothetical protein